MKRRSPWARRGRAAGWDPGADRLGAVVGLAGRRAPLVICCPDPAGAAPAARRALARRLAELERRYRFGGLDELAGELAGERRRRPFATLLFVGGDATPSRPRAARRRRHPAAGRRRRASSRPAPVGSTLLLVGGRVVETLHLYLRAAGTAGTRRLRAVEP